MTIPMAVDILRVEKPDPDLNGQILKPVWSSLDNGSSVSYSARRYRPNDEGDWIDTVSNTVEYSTGIGQLSPNAEYGLQVRAVSQGIEETEVITTTRSWTRAERPMKPGIASALSNRRMGIVFGLGGNPDHTEYAVRLATASEDTEVQTRDYADWDPAGGRGEALFNSADPVWRKVSDWNGGSLLLVRFAVYRGVQNCSLRPQWPGEVEGPGEGLAVEQSVGVPFVTLQSAEGIKTSGESRR
ncbi:MAG: hypothetical protein IPN19_02325 [Elusimicrobia bacterium]|nr:hypothetical protein [Elusimicrobiota bacterium]